MLTKTEVPSEWQKSIMTGQMLGRMNGTEFSQLAGHAVWYTTLESKLTIPGKVENSV